MAGLIWAFFMISCALTMMLTISRVRSGPHSETLAYALTTLLLAGMAALYLVGSHLAS